MAFSVLQQHELTSQPQVPLNIDQSNPLARSLFFAVTPIHNTRDAFDPTTTYNYGGVIGDRFEMVPSRGGIGYRPRQYDALISSKSTPDTYTRHSMIAVISIEASSYPIGYDNQISKWGDSNSYGIGMKIDGTPYVSQAPGGVNWEIVASRAVDLKKVVVVGYTSTPQGTTIYIDGKQAGFSVDYRDVGPGNVPRPYGYHGVTIFDTKNVLWYFSAAWTRALSAGEMADLGQNPYQLFRSSKNIYIPSLNQRTPWQQRESTILGTSSTMSNKSAIITSFKSVCTSQPQGLPIINWENSITDKLATAFLPSLGYPNRIGDAVTGLFDFAVSPAFSSTFGLGRLGRFYSPTYNVDIGNPSGRIPKYRPPSSYPGITVFTVFEFGSTGGTQNMLGGGPASTVYSHFLKNSDDSITYIYNSNSGGSINSSPLNLNKIYSAAGRQRFGTNFRELYIDKTLIGVDTSVQNNINSSYIFAGMSTTGGGTGNIKMYCSYVWLRELSLQEIYSLTDNPWQIFKPAARMIGGAR